MNQTPRWHLNQTDIYNSLFVLLHALVGALLTVLIQWLGHYDLGQYQYLLMTLIAFLSAIAKSWADGPPSPPPPTVVTPVQPTQPTA